MADDKSGFVTNKDELEEIKPSLKFKLKLPTKLDQDKDLASISSASKKEDEDEDKSLSRQPLLAKEEEEEEEEEEAETEMETEEEVKLQVSPFSNKGFSSVEALGSHSRVENKSNYKRKVNAVANVAMTTTTVDDGSSENQDEVMTSSFYKCPLLDCGKEFLKEKSLHGHMRSHPERDYRGMIPPSEMAATKVTSARFGTWRVTGKRGREGRRVSLVTYSSSAGSSESESEAERVEVANILLLLASGVGRDEYKGDYDNDYDLEDYEVKRAKKGKGLMMHNNDDDENYYLKSLGYLANYKLNHDYNGSDEVTKLKHDDYDDEEEKIKVAPIGTKISKKVAKISTNNHKIKSTNLESKKINHTENNENKFECTTCGKTFPTYQALGGHRSSHNKDKYTKNNSNNPTENPGGGGGGGGDGGQAKVMVNDKGHDKVAVTVKTLVVEHKCKTCEKTFETGQALGGHQRGHFNGRSPNVSSSSPGQSNNQTGQVGRIGLIDLNLKPDEDEGDDYIRADSSHNK